MKKPTIAVTTVVTILVWIVLFRFSIAGVIVSGLLGAGLGIFLNKKIFG